VDGAHLLKATVAKIMPNDDSFTSKATRLPIAGSLRLEILRTTSGPSLQAPLALVLA